MITCEVCSSSAFQPLFDKADHHFVQCGECGLERISPQPTDETLARIYGEHYYDSWGIQDEEFERSVAQLKKSTFRYVLGKLGAPSAGDKLLDCGAATGYLLEVAQELGYEPYGLELSEFGAKEIARKMGADRSFCGELKDAAFPGVKPGDFSVITMCDYIEHVRDPRQTLQLARKWLGDRGAVAITTPDAGSLSHRLLGTGWSHYKVEHLFYFNRRNLEQLLKEVGFSKVDVYPLWKSMTMDYIGRQFEVFPHKALTPLARLINRVAPAPVRRLPLPFTTGELLAVARV